MNTRVITISIALGVISFFALHQTTQWALSKQNPGEQGSIQKTGPGKDILGFPVQSQNQYAPVSRSQESILGLLLGKADNRFAAESTIRRFSMLRAFFLFFLSMGILAGTGQIHRRREEER